MREGGSLHLAGCFDDVTSSRMLVENVPPSAERGVSGCNAANSQASWPEFRIISRLVPSIDSAGGGRGTAQHDFSGLAGR